MLSENYMKIWKICFSFQVKYAIIKFISMNASGTANFSRCCFKKEDGSMSNWRERLMRFMQGRYGGNDSFNKTLFGVFLLFLLTAIFTSRSSAANAICNLIAIAVLVYSYYRIFSRNIERRRAENEKFLELTALIRNCFGKKGTDKTHRIFQCPQCGQKVRVPKGKGKIEITCPNCRNRFIKRS